MLLACAPKTGWQRTDARVCAEETPPMVCVEAEPDRALTVQVGDVEVLPGECVRAPEAKAKGALRLTVTDGTGHVETGRIRVRTSAINVVVVASNGEVAVRRVAACDGTVWVEP